MAKITIKNTKSKDELAYQTGMNLSNGEGLASAFIKDNDDKFVSNPDTVNPGAKTGKYGNGKKNNTMNLPLMGTNFQVSVEAGDEKTFDSVSSIQAMFLENAASVINEDKGNAGGYTPSGNHYEFELTFNMGSWKKTLTPSGEGITLQEGDTVKLSWTIETKDEDPKTGEATETVTLTDSDVYIAKLDDNVVALKIDKNSPIVSFVYKSYTDKDTGETTNEEFVFYNDNGNVEITNVTVKNPQTGDIEIKDGLREDGIETINSLSLGTITYEESMATYFESLGVTSEQNKPYVFKVADESITISLSPDDVSETHTIGVGDYYYYVGGWATGENKSVDLYIALKDFEKVKVGVVINTTD